MKNILIVGLGNIGLRHLEGILKINKKIHIFIIDKQKKKIKLLKQIKNKKIYFFNNINSIKNLKFKLVIFATNSKPRFFLLNKLLKNNIVKNIIFEKVVFQSSSQFKFALEIIKKKKINAWVNCTRRCMKFYKYLKNMLKNEGGIYMKFVSSKWEMGSNLIHYIDLFDFLINKKTKFKYENKLLKKIFLSKREGYHEFFGKIKILNNDNVLIVQNFIKNIKPSLSIISKNINIYIDLKKNKKNVKIKKNNILKYINFKHELVSNLAKKNVEKILQNKKIDLTTLNETWSHHRLIFKLFNQHLEKITKKKYKKCPIS